MVLRRAEPFLDWLLPCLWSALILFTSGSAGSARITESALTQTLGFLSASTFETLHFAIRKAGHVLAYGTLAYLVFRAMRRDRRGFERSWAFAAIGGVLLVSIADEWLQTRYVSRSGSRFDVMLDLTAALSVLVICRLRAGRVLFSSQ